jgi:ribonucleoside-diphosphate reductase alpha chain
LRERMKTTGLRNSLLIAIAPTATIASIVGCYECIEPQISNMFKRETLSGEFMQINKYLVNELKALGLWSEAMRSRIKLAEGSIQNIAEISDEINQDDLLPAFAACHEDRQNYGSDGKSRAGSA